MRELHSLLERQLKRLLTDKDQKIVERTGLLQAINDVYWQSDKDRQMLEHSMERTSQELLEMKAALQKTYRDLELRVAERTSDLYNINEKLQEELAERKRTEELFKKAEEQFRYLFESAPVGIGVADLAGNLLTFNDAILQPGGYSREDMEQLGNVAALYHDLKQRNEVLAQFKKQGYLNNHSVRFRRKDGSPYDALLSLTHITFNGKPSLQAIVQDATERNQAEQTLKESQRRYQTLFEDSPVGIWEEDFSEVKRYLDALKKQGVTDIKAYFEDHPEEMSRCSLLIRVLDINNTAVNLYQAKSKQELIEITNQTWSIGEQEHHISDFIAISNGHTNNKWEGTDETLTGEMIEIRLSWSVVPGYEKDYSRVIVITENITDTKKADAALSESESRLRAIVDSEPECVKVLDADGNLLEMNPAGLAMIEADSLDQVKGAQVLNLVAANHRTAFKSLTDRVVAGESGILEFEIVGLKGTHRWLETHAVPLQNPHGSATNLLAVTRDITGRKMAEARINEFANIVENMKIGVYVLHLENEDDDSSFRVVLANPAALQISGTTLDEVLGLTLDEAFPELRGMGVINKYVEVLSSGIAQEFEVTYYTEMQSIDSVYATKAFPISKDQLGIAFEKITERKQSESERQVLLEIMQGLTQTKDLQEFLKLIHASIAKIIYGKNLFVIIYNQDKGLFEEIYSVDQYDPPMPPSKIEKSITSYVFRTGKPVLMTQERFDELVEEGELELFGTNSGSWLGAPLKIKDRTIGVIAVQDYENSNRYTEQDQDFLASIASQVAIAIERKRADDILKRREAIMSTIAHSAQQLIRAIDWEDIVSEVLAKLGRATDVNRVYIFKTHQSPEDTLLASPKYEWVSLDTEPQIDNPDLQNIPMLEAGFSRWVSLLGNDDVVFGNVRDFPRSEQEILSPQNILSLAVVPIFVEEQWWGFIGFDDCNSLRTWEKAEIDALKAAAGNLGSAIQRKRSERVLQESRARYQSLFDNSPVLIWEEDYSRVKSYFDHLRSNKVTDFQEYFDNHPESVKECADLVMVVDVNRAALAFMKVEDKSALLGPLSKSLNEEAHQSFKSQLVSLANGHTSFESDEINTGKDGDEREIFISLSVSPEHVDTLSKVVVSIIDITDRKRAEKALRDSEERYRLLFDRMLDGVYRSTHDGKFVDVNPAMVKMFGYSSREEMLEVDIKNELYFAPDERGSHILDTGQEEIDIYAMRRKDGSEIWVEDHGSYVHDENGNVIFHEGILRDVTERKQAEEAIRAQDRLLLESQRIAKLGHYTLEIKTNMLEGSEALNDVLGIDKNYPGDINNWANLIHPDQREETLAYLMDHVLGDKKPFDREFQIIRFNDKQARWVHVLGRLENGEQGEPVRMIGTVQDITERKQVESETLRHLKETEALYENGLAISRLLTSDEIGQQLIKTFASYLSWHHVTIRLRKGESDNLELIAFNEPGLVETEKPEKARLFNSMITNVGQGLSGWVVKTGEPLRTGNVLEHPQYIRIIKEIRSGLYMPLKIGDRVLGIISVESEKPDAFSAQDERLLATLANQAAVAFENARLYQASQQELAERKRAENALRNSETHYRDLADSITDIMYELDQNLRLTHWNKSAELITGIPTAEALGKSLTEIFGNSKEQTDVEQYYLNVLSSRSPKSFEIFLNLNELERAYEINAYPSSTGVSVVAKDVTERKVSEIIMHKRFELMNFSAHNSLEEVMQKMLDDVSELVNSPIGFFHFMEEDQSTPGRQIWSTMAVPLFNDPAIEGNHRRDLDQAGVWVEAVRLRHPLIRNDYASLLRKKGLPEGHSNIIRELVIPIIRNDRVLAVLGIGNKPQDYTQADIETAMRFADQAWDIVEKKQIELILADERTQLATRVEERTADLIRANSNLARALRVKDEFLANMSHELRTPLNAILGLSESLGEQTAGPLNEKQLRYITTISESGHHLLALINDILDLAKIDAGQITLNINKVDINSISEASLRLVKQLALKKNQEVVLNIDNETGLMWADERRLKQMLVNLLSNAVKFTPENGRIGMDVQVDQTANQVSFSVWDHGIGIKDDDMSLLFQPFVQLDGGLARESAGTGLGLVLVAQMARLHGGGVTVDSLPGKGSRFTLTLPWEPALMPDTVERLRNTGRLLFPNRDDHGKRTILLIEDTEEVTMMLKDYLENTGYRVVTAQDGFEGINQANLTHPDLILMDIQMPHINGFEATKRLRDDPNFKLTPIIALTALAMPNDRERCIAAGMDEYISKPVNLRVLVKIIQNFLSDKVEPAKPR